MEEIADKSLKPIVLKTPLGFSYFDYDEIVMIQAEGNCSLVFTLENDSPVRALHNLSFIGKKYCSKTLCRCHRSYIINLIYIEKLLIKTHQVHLKNDLLIPLSHNCLRMIRKMSFSLQNPDNIRHFQDKPENEILNKMKRKVGMYNRIVKIFKKTIFRFLLISMSAGLMLLASCEGNERFYRQNLPEKLCSIGIINLDDTILRHISFEKSFQIEYPEEVNDSLREFYFSISSVDRELFNYQCGSTIKNLKNFKIPDSIQFNSGEKYYLHAREKGTPEISSEVIVPSLPAKPVLISTSNEPITFYEPTECGRPDHPSSAVINISFENNDNQRMYYALLLEGSSPGGSSSILLPFSGLLDFSVKDCNSPGFFAEMHGLNMLHYYCNQKSFSIITSPVFAYFIEGSKIPGNKCFITLSTQFSDNYSIYDSFKSFRIMLLSIPETMFLFEKSLYTSNLIKEDPFSEPVNLNGNIKGGIGVFALCRSSEIYISLPHLYLK